MDWLDAHAYIFDLDGTLICGGVVYPWAPGLLRSLGDRFVIVSNDAEHTPEQLSRFLRAQDVRVDPQRVVLAGTTTLDIVAREAPKARVLLLGGPALRLYARRLGLALVEAAPDVVVLARDRRFTYAKLAGAANAILAGAGLLATNADRLHPGPNGSIVPETGALLAALVACVGPMKPRVIGKPQAALFEAGLVRLGAAIHETVVIGDNEETDGEGARRLGLRFVRVERGDAPTLAPRQ